MSYDSQRSLSQNRTPTSGSPLSTFKNGDHSPGSQWSPNADYNQQKGLISSYDSQQQSSAPAYIVAIPDESYAKAPVERNISTRARDSWSAQGDRFGPARDDGSRSSQPQARRADAPYRGQGKPAVPDRSISLRSQPGVERTGSQLSQAGQPSFHNRTGSQRSQTGQDSFHDRSGSQRSQAGQLAVDMTGSIRSQSEKRSVPYKNEYIPTQPGYPGLDRTGGTQSQSAQPGFHSRTGSQRSQSEQIVIGRTESVRSQTGQTPVDRIGNQQSHTGKPYSHERTGSQEYQSGTTMIPERTGSIRSLREVPDRSGSELRGIINKGERLSAMDIAGLLQQGFVHLTGGRDNQGGPVISLPSLQGRPDPSPAELNTCLQYLAQLPSEESKRSGFSVVLDTRDGSWVNVGRVGACLQQTLADHLKQVLVVVNKSDPRVIPRPSISQTDYVTVDQLQRYIDPQQLTFDLGGQTQYNHSLWLRSQLAYEKFLKDATNSERHLEEQASQIQLLDNTARNVSGQLETLRRQRQLLDQVVSAPAELLQQGQELLNFLKENGYTGYTDNRGTFVSLDPWHHQSQVTETLQRLISRRDELRRYLDMQQKSLNSSVQLAEWRQHTKVVVDWVLGPGDKLLLSQTDIGDSYEAAEALRRRHEELEIKCTDTYGQYAELRNTIEKLATEGVSIPDDIIAERDYMDTVCRSFASRLDRRRTLLIASVRFHRYAEELSACLDDLLELFWTEVKAETVAEVEEAIQTLQDKCDHCDKVAEQNLNDGQNLLDEMSRPIKNAFGKDLKQDYSDQTQHVQKTLGELQERKSRCDELTDVRKLKLQQLLQLRTCERDTDQAIDWINELSDVMVASHIDKDPNSDQLQTLLADHQKLEATALGTYEYSKQLLQAALVLRRTLRYDLEPNHKQAQKLEEAWRRFKRGTSEKVNRLTVLAVFLNDADKLLAGMENLITACARVLAEGDPSGEDHIYSNTPPPGPADVINRLVPLRDQIGQNFETTCQMGQALVERLALPIILFEGAEKRLSIEDEGVVETVQAYLRKLDNKMAEVNSYWDELSKNLNASHFRPVSDIPTPRSRHREIKTQPGIVKSRARSRSPEADNRSSPGSSLTRRSAPVKGVGRQPIPVPRQRGPAPPSRDTRSRVQVPAPTLQQDLNDPVYANLPVKQRTPRASPADRRSWSDQLTPRASPADRRSWTDQPNSGTGAAPDLSYLSPAPEMSPVMKESASLVSAAAPEPKIAEPRNTTTPSGNRAAIDWFLPMFDPRAPLQDRLKQSSEWVRVRVHQMEPDLMDVGSNLEEALQLKQEHDLLMGKLKSKEEEVQQLLRSIDQQADQNRSQVDVHNAMADTLAEAWQDLNAKLAHRGSLLDQSVAFHQSAQDLSQSMEQAQRNFSKVPLAKDVETAQKLLQQHLDMKNSILETSKATLDMGQSLLDQIKEMGMHADFANFHATTAACYGIEHLLELLHDRRRHLEELWNQRKIRLEHCLQLCRLDRDVNQILEWYRGVGNKYLHNTELGSSYSEAQQIQNDHHHFEAQAREVQDNMLSLLRTADGLLRRASVDAEEIRQRLITVDKEAESFSSRLDIRRKNISMAVTFFKLAETALNKLRDVEFQLNNVDLPRNSAELSEQHSLLSQAIIDNSTEAIHEGRLLLERVSSVDPGADGVRQKMDELASKCTELEALCKARRAEAWQRSQDYLTYEEKFSSLQTWLQQIGLNISSRHNSMGTTLASATDFLEVHEQLYEDIRDKHEELSTLMTAANKLVQSGDPGAQQAVDRAYDLERQYLQLQRLVESRIQLALIYISFHRLAQQLSSNLSALEHIVHSETEDLQEITDSAVQSMREMFSKTKNIFDNLHLKGNEFLQNVNTVQEDTSLDTSSSAQTVRQILSDQRMNSVTSYWEAWEQRVLSSKQFKSQWHQFVQEARKTIDKVMQIENNFFPLISGELGDSLQQTRQLQARLDQFVPIYQVASLVIMGLGCHAEVNRSEGLN